MEPPQRPVGFQPEQLIAEDIDEYLASHRQRTLLRFITCGSVDDGKSTLIGRLLYDSKMIFDDQLAALEMDSRKFGTQGDALDFALLVDGLAAEHEQGITIDVAYRFFATPTRKYIVADSPGHEQYTRNMVTGASTADLAIILVDARKGVLTQTRRHSYLIQLMGVRHLVLAVNKMDLIGYDPEAYERIVATYTTWCSSIGIDEFTAIPMSALHGDNVTQPSVKMDWYRGPTLIDHLESVTVEEGSLRSRPFHMAVQWVNRPHLDFRGFSGLIGAGVVRPGDEVGVYPAARLSVVERIVTFEGDLDEAAAGESVTLCLTDEIDCSRGDILASTDDPPLWADQFEATIVWMADEPLLPERAYWIKIGSRTATVQVQKLKYQLNVNTMEHLAAATLELNGIGVANLAVDRELAFRPYRVDRELGGFILIDKITNATVAAGMLHYSLRRSQNVRWQGVSVTRSTHASLKNQQPAVLWITGVSGAGKSTVADLIERKLVRMNRHTFLLDGDNVRQGLSRDLGFSDADRVENIRRVGEVARLMTDAGLIVIAAFISPFRSERQLVRSMMEPGEFVEIHVDTPLEVAEERDVKGLYAKARSGQLPNFTGIDSPYERPDTPEIRIDTTITSPDEAAELIVEYVIGHPV